MSAVVLIALLLLNICFCLFCWVSELQLHSSWRESAKKLSNQCARKCLIEDIFSRKNVLTLLLDITGKAVQNAVEGVYTGPPTVPSTSPAPTPVLEPVTSTQPSVSSASIQITGPVVITLATIIMVWANNMIFWAGKWKCEQNLGMMT